MGLGTKMVESQTSYITRLAEAHYITVGDLIGKVFSSVLGKEYLLRSSAEGGSRFFETAFELDGFGKASADCSRGLEFLTGCTDIKYLNLVSWRLFVPFRGVIRPYKSWCPVCLEKWKKENQIIYEPLLRRFKSVNICKNI